LSVVCPSYALLPFDRFQMNIQEEIKTRGIFVDAVGAT